jgi:hypothetical protein
MFEKIILSRSEEGPPLTIGELAEALLFYQNVHIVLDWGSLDDLIRKIGMPTLLSLISRPNVSAVYCEDTLATRTEIQDFGKKYAFVGLVMRGSEHVGDLPSRKKRLEFLLSHHGYGKRQARRLIERFRRRVPIRRLTDNYYVEGGVCEAAWNDLLDPDFILESMRRILSYVLKPELLPSGFTFKIHPNFPSFCIDTNLNFESINAELKRRDPTLDDIDEALLINTVLMARADTILAANYGGEFYTSAIISEIISLKHGELLKRIGIDQKELKEFSEIIIQDGPSIREVLNSGERTFDEFLSLLDKSQKFREWAQGVNPDEKLVKAYFSDVTAEGWISKLPSKILRYLVSAAVGIFHPVAGLSVSAADSFLIEKILSGWRPNHFVQRQLKPFVSKSEAMD